MLEQACPTLFYLLTIKTLADLSTNDITKNSQKPNGIIEYFPINQTNE